jgi:predicted AAA+ superfamily ATPase
MSDSGTQWIPRHVLPVLDAALSEARVVVLHGPRQSGKTTLARRMADQRGGTYVTLDDPVVRDVALRDGDALLDAPRPVVLDEFQLGGDALLRAVKRRVDRDTRPGGYLLTGSTRFTTVPTISESLAGRAEIVDLWPLSQGEIRGGNDRFVDLLFRPTPTVRQVRTRAVARAEVLRAVCSGGYPAVHARPEAARRRWYSSYLRTVTERDVATISSVRDADALRRLLCLLAARTAQELNLAHVSRELELPRTTLAGYLPLLETLYMIQSLPAWSRNLTQRVVRHPKVHLADSGLAAALLGADVGALARPGHPALGSLVETFVVGELRRQATWARTSVELRHFRDHAGPEVDVVLETADGRVAGIEVKAASSFERRDARGLEILRDRLGDAFANGVVLFLGDTVLPLGDRCTAMPISALWETG